MHLDLEILGEAQKPAIYLHKTNTNLDKIRIAVLILVNILEKRLDLNTSTLQDIRNQVKDCDSILTLYKSNLTHISGLQENNKHLSEHSQKIKLGLENIIQLLLLILIGNVLECISLKVGLQMRQLIWTRG